MMTALYDSVTDNILFLRAGTPDPVTHTLWRTGAIHIYRPGDCPEILVTIDRYSDRTDWRFTDIPPVVCQLPLPPSHEWIPYDEVTYGLAYAEITAFDNWRRNPAMAAEEHPAHWDEYERPVLDRPPARAGGGRTSQLSWEGRPAPPELTLPSPAPSAPPASPPRPPRPQPATSSRHDLAAASGLPPLPPHVQRLVIDAAIAAGDTCPITMEPITADTAVITPCGHVFGTDLTRVSICPVCRSAL